MTTRSFSNYPTDIPASSYNLARKEIADYLAQFPEIAALVEFGTVSAPGISDLDLMVVFKDDTSIDQKSTDFSELSKDTRAFFQFGSIMKMNQSGFQSLPLIDDFPNIKFILGKPIDFLSAIDYPHRIKTLISLIDWLPERILRLNEAANSNPLKISNSLCLLHSIKYSLDNYTKLTRKIESEEINKFKSDIEELRQNWRYINDLGNQTLELLTTGIRLGLFIINEVSEIFDDEILSRVPSEDRTTMISAKIQIPIHYNQIIKFRRDGHPNTTDIFFPETLSAHYQLLGSYESLISKSIQSKLEIPKATDALITSDYGQILGEKLSASSRHLEFLNHNKLSGGLIRYNNYIRL